MASGTMTPEDIALIESRCFTTNNLPFEAVGAIHLFASNREVEDFNHRTLSAMQTEGAKVSAIDIVSGAPNYTAMRKALKSVSTLPTTQTYGLAKSLNIKVGARFMITVNIDTSDGLVNGTSGILKTFDYGINHETKERRPMRLWLDFDNVNIGKSAREKFRSSSRLYPDRIRSQWTPLEYATYTIKRWKSSNLIVQRTQFPMVPAEGITMHKSQGATMEKVVVHVTRNVKRAMLYVACSRATSASGLFLVTEGGKFRAPAPPLVTNPVVVELHRLESSRSFIPCFKFLRQVTEDRVQVVFHNVQSLRKHLPDADADPILKASHVVMFVETWSCHRDDLRLAGFSEISRIDGPVVNKANPGWGAVIFVRSDVIDGAVRESSSGCVNSGSGGGHCDCVEVRVAGVRLVAVYRSPTCPVATALECIHAMLFGLGSTTLSPVVVMGDFNVDFAAHPDTPLATYFCNHGLMPKLEANTTTTRMGTSIDAIFSNIDIETGVVNAFFSYHKQLWVRYRPRNSNE